MTPLMTERSSGKIMAFQRVLLVPMNGGSLQEASAVGLDHHSIGVPA